jgi:isomerase DpgB
MALPKVERTADALLRIDGATPPTPALIGTVGAACAAAEDRGAGVLRLVVHGAPGRDWARGLDVALVNKWERALRRVERLPVTTVGVAVGDCGGTALDALLTTDYRVATTDVRLLPAVPGTAGWPGMAVYRLAQQAGVARVRQAVLFGRAITAADALDLRLVDELVDEPDAVLAQPPGGPVWPDLAVRRRLLLDATTTTFENALGTHLAACDRALREHLGVPS